MKGRYPSGQRSPSPTCARMQMGGGVGAEPAIQAIHLMECVHALHCWGGSSNLPTPPGPHLAQATLSRALGSKCMAHKNFPNSREICTCARDLAFFTSPLPLARKHSCPGGSLHGLYKIYKCCQAHHLNISRKILCTQPKLHFMQCVGSSKKFANQCPLCSLPSRAQGGVLSLP